MLRQEQLKRITDGRKLRALRLLHRFHFHLFPRDDEELIARLEARRAGVNCMIPSLAAARRFAASAGESAFRPPAN